MTNKDILTTQLIDNIEAHNKNSDFQSYMVTISFNMTTHNPDYIESCIINAIRNARKDGSSNFYVSTLYKCLKDHRYKINTARNRNIYEYNITEKRLNFIWDNYDIFYSHLVQQLITNSSRKSKKHLQPLTFDFIDVNGSKHHNYVFDDDGSVHIHSIYLIRNEIADKFDSLIEQDFMPILWRPKLTGIRAVHGKPIGSEPGELRKVIEYNSKYMTSHSARRMMADMSLYSQYPLTDEERRQRRRDAQNIQADRSSL